MFEMDEGKRLFDEFIKEAEDFIKKEKDKERANIRVVVTEILEKDEEARGNDNYLILKVFEKMGWPTDLETISKNTINRFETISRARRKAQELNPMLMPEDKIVQRRNELEKDVREEMRGL